MVTKRDDESEPSGASTHDEDRDAILERRRRFVASAMIGLASASMIAACEAQAEPCLSPVYRGGDSSVPQPCLGMLPRDGSPGDATSDVDDASDAPADVTSTDADAGNADASDANDATTPPTDSGSD